MNTALSLSRTFAMAAAGIVAFGLVSFAAPTVDASSLTAQAKKALIAEFTRSAAFKAAVRAEATRLINKERGNTRSSSSRSASNAAGGSNNGAAANAQKIEFLERRIQGNNNAINVLRQNVQRNTLQISKWKRLPILRDVR